jgi:predicted aconitase with swiveling domain
LTVDPEVRLVVFGYDADQEGGEVWKDHKETLSKNLQGRLLMKGSPRGFINGISKYSLDVAA